MWLQPGERFVIKRGGYLLLHLPRPRFVKFLYKFAAKVVQDSRRREQAFGVVNRKFAKDVVGAAKPGERGSHRFRSPFGRLGR